MSLDKHVADRRRFARLLGTDDAVGSGLPVGSVDAESDDDPERDADAGRRSDR